MKTHSIKLIIAGLVALLFSACLKKDLPDYPLWDGSAITKVYVEYRYSDSTRTMYGQPVVAYQGLGVTNKIDTPSHTINLTITVPAASGSSFTTAVWNNVVQTKLWMYFDVSTAATVKPVGSTPKPGDPTDLTQPQQYEVTAANGSKTVWTIKVVSFIK